MVHLLSSLPVAIVNGLLFFVTIATIPGFADDGGVFPVFLAPAVASCLTIGAIALARGLQHNSFLLY
jgi:hypothetical protein